MGGLLGVISLQPIKMRAELDSSTVIFETIILRVSLVKLGDVHH